MPSPIVLQALEWIGRRAPDVEAELYLTSGEERGIELRNGAFDGLTQSQIDGVGLRVLKAGRMGFACAGGGGLKTIQSLFEEVYPQLPYLEKDADKTFPSPAAEAGKDPGLEASLWDESFFQASLDGFLPRLKEAEASVFGLDKRLESVLRLGYAEFRGSVTIANTRGVCVEERSSSANISVSTLSRLNSEFQVGCSYQFSRRLAELDFNRVARQAAERSTALLGAKKLPGGRRAVLFDPWVAGELLELIAGLLGADQVQRGKSLLAGKLGKKVGSPLVNFKDDPRLRFGLGSSLFDDEGCPTRAKTMIESGVVSDYFYDTAAANRDGRASNASAGRESFKGLPHPSCSNFFLDGGPLSREQIISDTQDGILVLDIMGMHTADPISGEFSVGVSGLALRNGRLAHAVSGAMISGNILELLGRIDAVGNDLTFYGALGAPTFRISHMTVA